MEENQVTMVETGETHAGFTDGLCPGESPREEELVQGAPQEAASHQEAPQWTLRHLDEEKTVCQEEMIALAQKGLDYDRVREKYEAAKPVMATLQRLCAKAGVSMEEYLSGARARDGSSPEGERAADLAEFHAAFPHIANQPAAIPQEVWDEVRGGRTLVAAYAMVTIAQLKQEREALLQKIDTLRREGENARRSTGSLRSRGESPLRRDPFTSGWEA